MMSQVSIENISGKDQVPGQGIFQLKLFGESLQLLVFNQFVGFQLASGYGITLVSLKMGQQGNALEADSRRRSYHWTLQQFLKNLIKLTWVMGQTNASGRLTSLAAMESRRCSFDRESLDSAILSNSSFSD